MANVTAFRDMLHRALRAAGPAAYGAAVEGAQEIAAAMKSAVPRDKGALAQSIRVEQEPGKLRVYVKAGGPTTTHNTKAGPYDYANAQEYGTQSTPAAPFFWPMWRLLRKKARSRINREMKKAIEAVR